MEKPLFIPLKREFFEAFEAGTKAHEYRRHGTRWNEETCRIGRRVVISLGYGKQRRRTGTVISFDLCHTPQFLPGWIECYGDTHSSAAMIGIELDA